ncbi:hypothetical protein F2P81_017543 [Scophthalmus maximus]|uniref:Uncharacterized protein n=1 Tax=Scophthalmus maximus TaxID=52904 RepID=A0A6A4SKB5_SCOMX|nr:hypothetical protein F2P81_017543 [Scophthalmus maximus]
MFTSHVAFSATWLPPGAGYVFVQPCCLDVSGSARIKSYGIWISSCAARRRCAHPNQNAHASLRREEGGKKGWTRCNRQRQRERERERETLHLPQDSVPVTRTLSDPAVCYGGTSKPLNSSRMLCGGWLTQKKWESLNLNISRRTRLFLQLEDFFWREHLSNLALPYGIKGSELLLLKVLAVTANYQVPANIEKLECRTCVVVGNGFAIKNSSLGSLINQYDVVIRLNDAPVRGYEEDVGNKTTMRLFYPESASYDPGLHNEPGALMVLVPFKQQDLRWLKEILYDEKRKPVHPTTGILAVFVALNYCDVVHVAGFGYPNSKSQRVPIHYYGYDTMRSMKRDTRHSAVTCFVYCTTFLTRRLSLKRCTREHYYSALLKHLQCDFYPSTAAVVLGRGTSETDSYCEQKAEETYRKLAVTVSRRFVQYSPFGDVSLSPPVIFQTFRESCKAHFPRFCAV